MLLKCLIFLGGGRFGKIYQQHNQMLSVLFIASDRRLYYKGLSKQRDDCAIEAVERTPRYPSEEDLTEEQALMKDMGLPVSFTVSSKSIEKRVRHVHIEWIVLLYYA